MRSGFYVIHVYTLVAIYFGYKIQLYSKDNDSPSGRLLELIWTLALSKYLIVLLIELILSVNGKNYVIVILILVVNWDVYRSLGRLGLLLIWSISHLV